MRRGMIGITASVVCAVALTAVTSAGAEVGNPPTNDYKRCDRYSNPCGDPVIVAEGRQYGGPREVVGMSRNLGACLSFERPDKPFGLLTFPCDERVDPRPKEPLRVELILSVNAPEGKWTEVGGVLHPGVARVQAVFRRGRRLRRKDAITSQLDRELSRAIGFERRVGVFDLGVAGHPLRPGRHRRFRLKTYDADGQLLGVKRSPFG